MGGIANKSLRRSIQRPGHEGRSSPIGYVPTDSSGNVIDNSGVTIGVGFDLGQHNDYDLKKMGFSKDLRTKLKDFLGKKGSEAKKIAGDLKVSGQDYLELILRPINYKIDRIAEKYDKKAGKDSFKNLEPELQKTIFSVMYQMGVEGETGAPEFWRQATSKDWTGMLNNMQSNGWGKTQARRTRELDILLKSGAVQRQFVFDMQKKENFLSD